MKTSPSFPVADVIRAQVIVVALEEFSLKNAAFFRIAKVCRAFVVVIADDRITNANTVRTGVIGRAVISIAAGTVDDGRQAVPCSFFAYFHSAGIAVIAVECDA